MSWDLEKKKITLDQQAGKESSQILLEGDVIVLYDKKMKSMLINSIITI